MTHQLSKSIIEQLKTYIQSYPRLNAIIAAIDKTGGIPILVGGAVRDLLLEKPIKDLDIEVHNLSLAHLQELLEQFGPVSLVGKQFGVLRLHHLDIDWSLPRADSAGRKPEVIIDPNMGFKQAFERRDVTMNAMGINLITYELIDPFKGFQDLIEGRLRTPSAEKFIEDPLRLFRVMQFIGRYNMMPDTQLEDICRSMDISTVSRERIEQEFEKLLLKSPCPSLGIRWLDSIGRLEEVLPELAVTKGVKQSPKWHPEGGVFEHSMQALNAAAHISRDWPERERLVLLYAALCHDLGKVSTTRESEGKITSHGHALESEKLAKRMLVRITQNQTIIQPVLKLVRYHMQPLQFLSQNVSLAAYKRLAKKLSPETTIEMLSFLALADRSGRNPAGDGQPLSSSDLEIERFVQRAREANVLKNPEEPIVQGKDLLKYVKPGPAMGKLLQKAYDIQMQKGIVDKAELIHRILSKSKKIT